MRNIAVALIVGSAVICNAAASELSPQQFETLMIAERHWEQGNFTEVEATLQVLRNPENDEALRAQVETFLTDRSSERAVMTALMMHNETWRNRSLFHIFCFHRIKWRVNLVV